MGSWTFCSTCGIKGLYPYQLVPCIISSSLTPLLPYNPLLLPPQTVPTSPSADTLLRPHSLLYQVYTFSHRRTYRALTTCSTTPSRWLQQAHTQPETSPEKAKTRTYDERCGPGAGLGARKGARQQGASGGPGASRGPGSTRGGSKAPRRRSVRSADCFGRPSAGARVGGRWWSIITPPRPSHALPHRGRCD